MPLLPPTDLDHVLGHTRDLWEPLRGSSVFLTGGTGFVGSWLLASLLRANDEFDLGISVVVLTRNPHGFRARAPELAAHPAVRLHLGNVVDFVPPAGDFPYVIHAATEVAVPVGISNPLGSFAADAEGTRRVLEFARTHGARRLLFTSSGAVYGAQPTDLERVPEDFAGAPSTTDSCSSYGQAKRVSEFMCTMYGHAGCFDTIIARLFAFVGPLLPLDAHYAVGNFVRDALRGGPIRIAGDGTPWRSYLYAADLVIWLWTILLRGQMGRAYNVGSSRALTIADLARRVAGLVAPGAEVTIAKARTDGCPAARYVPATTRAETELGLRSLIGIEEGIRRMAEWNRAKVVLR